MGVAAGLRWIDFAPLPFKCSRKSVKRDNWRTHIGVLFQDKIMLITFIC